MVCDKHKIQKKKINSFQGLIFFEAIDIIDKSSNPDNSLDVSDITQI